jgi:peroxiredoxin Q/BCP
MKRLESGARAPKFQLDSDSGEPTSLDSFADKWLVLYFYPRDNTPGCTREAEAFTASLKQFAKLGAAVVGVSKDSVKSHCGFRDKVGIGFPLLSDPDLAAHRAYGAWGEKTMYGKKVEGTIRSTFLIAPDATVARAWRSVKVDGHAEDVLQELISHASNATVGGSAAAPSPVGSPRSPERSGGRRAGAAVGSPRSPKSSGGAKSSKSSARTRK